MYKITITETGVQKAEFKTEAEAIAFVKSKKKAKTYFTITHELSDKEKAKIEKAVVAVTTNVVHAPPAPKVKAVVRASWKDGVDMTGAVEITRENVKSFYNKSGYIQVIDVGGNVKHIGRTINMGKVFSNYVNCANYNQSYDFNLAGGDKLLFKESAI
jgi:hypothetical protein